MSGDEQRSALRGAIARSDVAAVVQQLTGGSWRVDALQLVRDGLLIALGQRVEGDPVEGGGRIDLKTSEV